MECSDSNALLKHSGEWQSNSTVPRPALATFTVPFVVSCFSGKSRHRLCNTSGSFIADKIGFFTQNKFLGRAVGETSPLTVQKVLDQACELRRDRRSRSPIQMLEAVSAKSVTSLYDSFAELCINAIRFLAIDAIENAKSGHPGMPMGMAPAAYILFDK